LIRSSIAFLILICLRFRESNCETLRSI